MAQYWLRCLSSTESENLGNFLGLGYIPLLTLMRSKSAIADPRPSSMVMANILRLLETLTR